MEHALKRKISNFANTYNKPFLNGRLHHAAKVKKYALMLAKKENADMDIVEIAALLHNICCVIKRGHPKHSADESKKFLDSIGFPEKDVKRVYECIRRHRAIDSHPESLEAKIIAAADSIAFLENKDTQMFIFKVTDRSHKSMVERISRIFGKIHLDSAKEMAKPLFEMSMNYWKKK
jgi:HD superfamily phosphodiesterase